MISIYLAVIMVPVSFVVAMVSIPLFLWFVDEITTAKLFYSPTLLLLLLSLSIFNAQKDLPKILASQIA